MSATELLIQKVYTTGFATMRKHNMDVLVVNGALFNLILEFF